MNRRSVTTGWAGRPSPGAALTGGSPHDPIELARVVEVLAAGLRAGTSWPDAWLTAAAAAPDGIGRSMNEAVEDVDLTSGWLDSVRSWGRQADWASAAHLAIAVELGVRTGVGGADLIERVARSVRADVALDDLVRSATGQTVMSASVMVALPVVFLGLVVAQDERLAAFVFSTSSGRALLVAAALLDLAGAWWMSRIIRSVR